jgi:hypothetical protein
MERSIEKVLDELLVVIPTTEMELIKDLKDFQDNLWNKAPEVRMSREGFLPVQNILCKHILLFDTKWKLDTLHIFNNSKGL